jgi:hypothetical protein
VSANAPDPAYRHFALESPGLPLAVYREIVAHLQQVNGVEAGLVSQTSTQFDYQQSQIGHLWVRHPVDLDPALERRLQQILNYYGDRFSTWRPISLD